MKSTVPWHADRDSAHTLSNSHRMAVSEELQILLTRHVLPRLQLREVQALSQTCRSLKAAVADGVLSLLDVVPPAHPFCKGQLTAQLSSPVMRRYCSLQTALRACPDVRPLPCCRPDLASALSPDGASLALVHTSKRLVGPSTQAVQLVDVVSGKTVQLLKLGKADAPNSSSRATAECTFSPDSQRVLVTALCARMGGIIACVSRSSSAGGSTRQVMQQQAWASHSQLFTTVAWSPCSQLAAVGLGQPLQGSAHLLVLDSSLNVLQQHSLQAAQLAWSPCSKALAALHATHHSRSSALKLQLHSVAAGPTPSSSMAASLQCGSAMEVGMQRLCHSHEGVRSVQWSQQGAFMLLSSWQLSVALPKCHVQPFAWAEPGPGCSRLGRHSAALEDEPGASARVKYQYLSWHSANPMLWAAWAPLGDRIIVAASAEHKQGRPSLESQVFVMRIVGGSQLQPECILAPLMRGLLEALETFGRLVALVTKGFRLLVCSLAGGRVLHDIDLLLLQSTLQVHWVWNNCLWWNDTGSVLYMRCSRCSVLRFSWDDAPADFSRLPRVATKQLPERAELHGSSKPGASNAWAVWQSTWVC